MPFVLDNSITMSWLFEDEANSFTETLLDRLRREGAIVPGIWPLEVVNVLLVGERRQRVNIQKVPGFLAILASLPIRVMDVGFERATGTVLTMARLHHLSSYDAAYLDLALREGLPLATRDEQLRAAARRTGVSLVG